MNQWAHVLKALCWIVIGISISLIILTILQDRSLFLDSLNLALNIAERSYAELTTPLDYDQSAPVLYLWAVKLSTEVWDISHFSLRLPSILFGISSLLLLYRICEERFSPLITVIMLAWLGIHEIFVRYSTESKQYIGDLAASLLLIYMYDRFKPHIRHHWLLLLALSTLCLWLSMPALFVIAGLLLALWLRHTSLACRAGIALVALIIILQFAVQYFALYDPVISSGQMRDYHARFFFRQDLSQMSALLTDLFRLVIGKSGVGIALTAILTGVGIVSLSRDRFPEAVVLVLPIVLAFVASSLGRYSIIHRLMLFSLPLMLLLIGHGLQVIVPSDLKSARVRRLMLTVVVGLLIIAYSDISALQYCRQRLEKEDNRTCIQYMDKINCDFPVVCSQFAHSAIAYYTEHDKHTRGISCNCTVVANYTDDMLALTDSVAGDKVWVLLHHMNEDAIADLSDRLAARYFVMDEYLTKEAACILIRKK